MTPLDRALITEQLKPVLLSVSNGRAKLEPLSEEALLIEDIGLASLDLLELRFELETRWSATITDEEAISLKTIRDVVNIIVAKAGGQTA